MKYLFFITSKLQKTIFTFLAIAYCLLATSQNLVPNPSFENYSSCPTSNSSEVYLATPWVEVEATADYYNCSSLDNSYIARTGSGYMGVSTWRPSWSETYREYIGVPLTQSLIAGQAYYGEFWVRLQPDACWANDGLGMYVSTGQPSSPLFGGMLYVTPQIMNPQYRMLIGREYWMKVCGSFVAQGGENFITLGSFLDDDQSTFLELSGCPNQSYGVHWSYYHLDDVLLEEYDSTANYGCDENTTYNNPDIPNDSTITNCNLFIPNVFSPNGDSVNDLFDTDFPLEKYIFYIYDRWGREVYYTWQSDSRSHYWDGRFEGKILPDGVYYYILYSISNNCEQKGTITILR